MKVALIQNSARNGDKSWLIYCDGRLVGRSNGDFGRTPAADDVLKLIGVECETRTTFVDDLVPRESLADLLEDVYRQRRLHCERQLRDAQAALQSLEREFGRAT